MGASETTRLLVGRRTGEVGSLPSPRKAQEGGGGLRQLPGKLTFLRLQPSMAELRQGEDLWISALKVKLTERANCHQCASPYSTHAP